MNKDNYYFRVRPKTVQELADFVKMVDTETGGVYLVFCDLQGMGWDEIDKLPSYDFDEYGNPYMTHHTTVSEGVVWHRVSLIFCTNFDEMVDYIIKSSEEVKSLVWKEVKL